MIESGDLIIYEERIWLVRRVGFAYLTECLNALEHLGVQHARLGLTAPGGEPQLTLALALPDPETTARHRRFTVGEMKASAQKVRDQLPGTSAPAVLSVQSIIINAGATREWVNLGDSFAAVDSFAARAFMDPGSKMRQCLIDLVVSQGAFIARARVGFDGPRPPLPETTGPESSEVLLTNEIVALGLREPLAKEVW